MNRRYVQMYLVSLCALQSMACGQQPVTGEQDMSQSPFELGEDLSSLPVEMEDMAEDMVMLPDEDDMPKLPYPCARNEYVISHVCVECPSGSTNDAGDNLHGENTQCDPIICKENERVEDHRCVLCPRGGVNASGDDASGEDTQCDTLVCGENEKVFSNRCISCESGSINEPGDEALGEDTQCETLYCDVDEYVKLRRCEPCLPGSINDSGDDASGEDTQCDIIYCGQDEYVEDHGCVTCPAGSTNEAGDDATQDDTMCDGILCPSHQHVVNHTCVACPAGSTNEAGDDATAADTECDPVLCEDGEHVQANLCVSCGPAYTNEAGDDATGPDTMCEPLLCGADERVSNSTCIPCDPGMGNDPGDDARLGDTECEVIYCSEDEYVLSHVCTPCVPGSVNEAGDNASDIDTSCDVVYCEENTFVQNHTCQPCAQGLINEAGDDARLADTSCHTDICLTTLGISCNDMAQHYIKADVADPHDNFGYAIAFDGTTLIVGAPLEDSGERYFNPNPSSNTRQDTGAVYVFERSGNTWIQRYYVKAINTKQGDQYGYSVAIDGDRFVVGAPFEDSWVVEYPYFSHMDYIDSGMIYVYKKQNAQWQFEQIIKTQIPDEYDNFGSSVAIDGTTIVAGAYNEGDTSCAGCGAAYVFERVGDNWTETAKLTATSRDVNDNFGYDVAISNQTIVVGTYLEDSASQMVNGNYNDNSRQNCGAAYVFEKTNGVWQSTAYLKANVSQDNLHFGKALDIDGNRIAVGAPGEGKSATGIGNTVPGLHAPDSGAVYIFERSGATWVQTEYIKASNTDANDRFGEAVDLDGARLVVAAPYEDGASFGVYGDQMDNSAENSGALYLFEISGTTWSQLFYIKSFATDSQDLFGWSVALAGSSLMTGTPYEASSATGIDGNMRDNTSLGQGAVYEYMLAP